MLAQLIRFEEETTLVMRSGIQFLDFGLTLDLRKELPGQFARIEGSQARVRLEHDEASGAVCLPGTRTPVRPAGEERAVAESVRLFEDLWLPVPFLRWHAQRFVEGPSNWARARLVTLRPGEDPDGHTHRLLIAFDTRVDEEEIPGAAYLAPGLADVTGGARFALAWRGTDMGWFTEQGWVSAWLEELYRESAERRLRMDRDDIARGVAEGAAVEHYLNLLWIIGGRRSVPDGPPVDRLPRVRLLGNRPDDVVRPIEVDMVLDVGNSRTFGILVEDHLQAGDGLKDRYVLELRDLTRPQFLYAEPFESRIEFAEAAFGKVDHSCHSGRNDAFVWPTIARVGPEAARLASRRRGTEGATGLSSPKRYLWDEDAYVAGWRFNDAFNKGEAEPHATAAPFGDLVNDRGEALCTLPPEEQYPVFIPHYTRSSLMTFMLAEVLVQALGQMNSAGQRMRMKQAHAPRRLRSLILTVPPSMPRPERAIFEARVRQAIALVWKGLGWHPAEAPVEGDDDALAWPRFPTVRIQWDEATCAQVVYLFSETVNHFGGRPEEVFRVMRRRRPGDAEGGDARSLTVASIDIGGGTTDLVITDFTLDDGRGGNVYIRPEQRFRDGFKVAGDDVVLEVIQAVVLPALAAALKERGLSDPGPLLSRLMGSEAGIVQDMVLRQQLALQVMYPLALRILKAYEQYDPVAGAETHTAPIGERLGAEERPSDAVIDYVRRGVRTATGGAVADFDLLAVPLPVDLGRLHGLFLTDRVEIGKTIRSLCEIVHLYDCDVLLVSGRPSRLPGVQALLRALLPLPPDRIVPLHNYRTGGWYPFSREERIDDPKTTAAVGAMLCVLGQGRIPNFFFRANELRIYSTVRHIGLMDQHLTIRDADVYYRDVDLDSETYTLPDTPFEMRGRMVLGFRQLTAERWGASPLYVIDFAPDRDRHREDLYGGKGDGLPVLQVALCERTVNRAKRIDIQSVARSDGTPVGKSALRIRLNTLNTVGLGETSYWLDTGSIVR